MRTKAYLALATPVLVWGIAPAFIRSFSQMVGAWDSMFIRMTSVALMCLPFLFWSGIHVARSDWLRLLLVSWIGMFGYFLGSIFGFEYVKAGIGSIIIAIQPLIIAVLASLFGTEKLTTSVIVGLLVSFAGTIYLFSGDPDLARFDSNTVFGVAMLMLCNVAFSINVVYSRPLVQRYGAMRVTLLTMILAAVPALGFFQPGVFSVIAKLDLNAWATLIYLGFIGTILVVIFWNYAVGQLRPATVGASLYAIPVLGALSGWVVLGETLTWQAMLAGLIIIAGVAISEFGKSARIDQRWIALGLVMFAVVMWGCVPVAMRYLLVDLPPETAMVLRLYPAGVAACIILLFTGMPRMAGADVLRLILAALLGNGAYQVLAAYGIDRLPASWTGMLFGLEPVFIALFAVMFGHERPTFSLAIGIVIALFGTAILVLGGATGAEQDVTVLGVVLVAISTLGWAIYTTLIRPVSAKYGPVATANAVVAVTAIPIMLWGGTTALPAAFTLNSGQWLATAFLSIFATVFAVAAWNYALGHMSSSLAGMFLYVQPIVAAIGGIALLGEQISIYLVAGGLLIILGVLVSQFGDRLGAAKANDDSNDLDFEFQR
jgi:drug/metabolite transporter (DMT)-like permease